MMGFVMKRKKRNLSPAPKKWKIGFYPACEEYGGAMVEAAIVLPVALMILSLFLDTAIFTYNKIALIDNTQAAAVHASAGDDFECDVAPLMFDEGSIPDGLHIDGAWGTGTQTFIVETTSLGPVGAGQSVAMITVKGTMANPCFWCGFFDADTTATSTETGRGGTCPAL